MGQFSVVVVLHTELVEDPRYRPGHSQRVVEWHRQTLGASGSQAFADLHEIVSVAAAQRGGGGLWPSGMTLRRWMRIRLGWWNLGSTSIQPLVP